MATTLQDSARWAGSHRWTELRLFEILGQWVTSTALPAAKLLFDGHSQHHAWRAAQWWDRLPVLAGVDRESLTTPASPELVVALEHMAGFGSVVGRLAGAYRVMLPRQWVRYQDHLDLAGAVADSSTLRTLNMVSRDLASDWMQGERALQKLLGAEGTAEAAAEASTAVAELEATLTATAARVSPLTSSGTPENEAPKKASKTDK